MTEITFDFACTDDCLNKMVPSDLRQLVSERDTLRQQVKEAANEIETLRQRVKDLEIRVEKATHWAKHAMLMRSSQNKELLCILQGEPTRITK